MIRHVNDTGKESMRGCSAIEHTTIFALHRRKKRITGQTCSHRPSRILAAGDVHPLTLQPRDVHTNQLDMLPSLRILVRALHFFCEPLILKLRLLTRWAETTMKDPSRRVKEVSTIFGPLLPFLDVKWHSAIGVRIQECLADEELGRMELCSLFPLHLFEH